MGKHWRGIKERVQFVTHLLLFVLVSDVLPATRDWMRPLVALTRDWMFMKA